MPLIPKSVPQQPGTVGGAATLGAAAKPVNASFVGPNDQGFLYDVPPQFGLGPAPLAAVTGKEPPRLGKGGGTSPKTKG